MRAQEGLSRVERHRLLVEWNDTASAYPRRTLVQHLVAQQAAARPEAVAAIYGEHSLSYGELDRRARALAHRLRRLGVGVEDRVGVFLEPGCDLVVALLGILQAGGAYLPLDRAYPRERLAFMLADAEPKVVVTQTTLIDELPASSAQAVALDRRLEEPTDHDLDEASTESFEAAETAAAGRLAYIIYTSGSTGRPKGVGIPHRGITRLVLETNYITLSPRDRVGQAANTAFDAATLEIWGPLLTGGCIVEVPRDTSLVPRDLAAALRRFRVNTLFLTTALFNQTIREAPDAFAHIDNLMVGGETADPAWMRRMLGNGSPRRFIHVYGPTENTTYTTGYQVRQIAEDAATVPIGAAIANSTVFVLDQSLWPVAAREVGELLTGGDGLARNYWQRPRLTAGRFVPDPFAGQPGGRLYRTGDLTRWLDDGVVDYVGRVDHQIKLRGFRVELGEIEAALAAHPQVTESAVLLQATSEGARGSEDKQLVAHLSVRDNEAETAGTEGGDAEVARWGMIFDEIYGDEDGSGEGDGAGKDDPTFNITGWVSTYDEQPIPAPEMRQWLADTIDRILDLQPRRALEIGCGTGLLLTRIAPRCEAYLGTDISGQVLGQLEQILTRRGDLPQVRLAERPADCFDDIEDDAFDTVILNSVVQYFPNAEYLATVLHQAVRAVRPGGAIFVGDVRSLPLLDAFHTSVELHQAPDDLATAELRRRIVGRGRIENELVIDPAFFAALAQELPRLGRVEIHPKRGQAHNELTGFRYQVVLRVGEAVPPPEIPWLDWRDDGLTLDALHQRLAAAAETTDPLGLQAIPNARVARAAAATHLLASDEAPATAGQLRQAVASDPTVATAVDPQALCDLATQMGFEIELGWADPRADGRLSAVLRSQEGDPTIPISAWLPMPTADPQASVATFANQPTQAPAARLETDELRAFLGQRLPEYMVPASFVFLDRLPLTQNGKIDRTALARLETAPTGAETFDGNGQPRTPLEEQLAAIWADVLGRQRVGIHDDFLALGGHSLRATQVVSRIRSQLRAEITIRQVMEVTTVAELARLLTTLQASDPSTVEPDLVPRSDIDTPPPASFAQQRLWFLERWLPGNLAYSVPLVLRFSGHLRVAALVPALGEIARRHEALRTTFQDSEAGPIQVIAPPSSALDRLPMVDLSALGDAGRTEAEALLQREARRPFDLARGPLWRKLLLRLDPTRHLLLCNLHHIVFDGWSQGIFFRELAALYDAAVLGKTAVLAHLPVQPADFAKWQQAWLQGDTLEAELSYWRDRLAGASGLLRLPTDRPRPAVQRYRGAIRTFEVPAALKSRLEDLAGQRGGTLFMVAMAGFMALMARLTGQRDLIIATGVANRSRQVIEPLIGFFVNTLPLRAELFNDPSFNAIVDATRREALAAFAHQDVPFAKLIEALRPERDLSVAPLVQALLVLQTAPMEPVQPTDLELDYRLLPIGASRFDFGLELTASGDGLIGSVEYNTDLFEATTIDRWLAHFVELLDGAVDEPRRSLSQLPLLSAAQRQQLRTEWHDDAWVVDAWGQTAPIGVVGQLHPASEAADASARTRHDGALEHLARDDARVESGGFRLADRLPRRQHDGAGATATPLEEQLAGIWRQLLALDEVGPDDDFFHLGGHSLLATRLISRLRTTLGIELPVTALFEHPTVATLARRIEALLAEQAMTARPELPPLRPRPTSEHDLVPPSFAQERLWFLYQWQPESPIYNVPMLLSLRGPLAVGALQAALQAIERRHEALRTVFAAADQPLAQRIRPWTPRPLPQIDLTHLRPADAAEATRRHLRHAARRPFNLEQGPLWRRWLVRSGAESYALFSGFHHIVFDGWSTGILCHELEALYAAFSAGRAPALPEPAVQYADFALWQRAWLDESRQTQEIDYWRQRLAGAPDLLELPTDRPRGPQDQARGDWLALRLPAPLHSALVELSRRQGVTLFMTLLAAFDVLLARLSAQRDVVIGTPIANRTDEATESMIGFFVNTLVLRNEVGTDSTFDQLLRQIRHTTLEAYAHQQLPFEKLVEALQPTRNLHHTPLFQVSLGLQNATSFQPRLAGLEVELSAHDLGVAKYDFSLLLEEGGLFDPRSAASTAEVTATGASGIAEYRSDLFDATTIRRWLDHLAQILTVAVHDPSTPVDDLPLLEPAAQRQLVSEWNDSAVQYPEAEVAAHRMFERQARIRPEAVAVQSGDEHLTYEALRCQSHRLARQLAQHGVGIEDRVGLCLECVPERIIAVLAVLEAGGVYVPIEPGLPAERRRVLLEDSGAVCWLSAESTPAEASIRWVDPTTLQANETRSTETESAGPIDRATLARRSAASPEQLAYVLYTSGSTGLPKGVMISHGTLSNLLCWAIDALGLTPRDRTLHRIPIGFDPSVFEMLLPLASGGRLVLGGPDSAHDAAVVVREIAERRIETLILVPTMASLILQDPEVARAAGLRRMFCGGETLTLELAERFATSPLKGIELINGYGPTEACVLMTCERLRPESLAGEPQHPAVTPHGSLAIGRPLANTKAYGFDPRLRPSPVGVPGELFIGGVCLARGYLADPRKTAAAFVPNAHGDEPGGRLYRSGDLVRSLPDGRWVFLRRRDLQIKLRGQRIEPGEIEAALIAHPAIGNAVITVHSPTSEDTTDRSDPADRLLVAWLEGTSDGPPPTETLRRDLLDSLPAYMVPALFQWLEALPLNSSGKVDRGALERRPVTLEPDDREGASTAPRTPTEEILLGIWSDILQRNKPERGTPKRDTPQQDTLGPNDNFFDLGGHSLLATRVTSRASAVFDTDLGPRDLFENPTVGLLAEAIDRGLRSGPDSAAPSLPLEPVDRATPLPLSFAQARLWFLDQLAPGSLTYNSTFPLGLEGQLDVAHLQRAFQELVARHEVLRTTFALAGDEPVQVITPPAEHPMPWVDLAHLEPSDRARQVERLTFEDEQRPFDLVRGPLVRTLLLRQADDQHALLLSIHHIVFDGWSLPILLSEVAAFYRTGLDPASTKPLTALPVQYADYAAWQRQRLSGDALQAELDYWRQALSSTMPPARMALDIPRAQAEPSRVGHARRRTSADTATALVELGRHEGATLFMTLLAVYQTLLHRSTGAETVVVGTPVANRHPLAIEGLIGFFVNTLAIGADFTGRPTFRQILARVRQAALGAYAHQELPFEKLVETLYPNRQTGVQPVFQSMFALGDLQLDPVTVPGLTFRPLPAAAQGERGAAFELSCGVTQAGDRLSIQLDYDRSLFYSNTIETLLERFVRLADEVAADPDRPIAEIEIMSEAEEQAILQAASAPAIDDSTSPTDPSQAPGEDALAAEKRNESKLRAKVTGRKKGLSDAKRALLAKRLKGRKKKKGAPSPDAIPRRSPDAPAPLSFSQERLWFLDQLEPGGSTYNMTLPLRLRNRLDRAALEASFDELWRRHEITRTRFRAVDGVPVQVIDPPRRRALPLVDFGALGAADRRGQVERWIAAEVEGSFDLTRGPLVRVLLMRTSADAGDEAEEHIVLFNIHHIACDGWSMGILTSELGALYQSCAGRSGKAWRSPLAELPIQYADYASWQRGWLQGAELERQLGYWQRQLGDAAQVLELPTDRPRPAIQTFRGVAARQQLDGDFADRLRALSRTADTTLFVTLLSPFAALLGRLAGQRDVLIGTPIAGRSRSQLEGLVGMFLNTLVMRADLADNPTFRQLLGRLREVSLEAYGHQDLPFEKLLEALTPERDLSRTPVFQVFFNLLNLGRVRSPAVPGEGAPTAAQAAAKSDGSYLVIEDLQEDGDAFEVASKFDLTLYVDDHARELTIDWVYNADLFDPARIQAMAAQYENLLRQMVADPDTSIDTVPLLNDAARTLLPDPTRPLSDRFEGTVAEVFARCAAESPDGVAVVDPEVTLTYGTLAAASADLARSLRDLDVAPGDVVAIYGHRSAPLVAALLGTLGAGAAFLILDPAYPAARGVACLSQAEPRGFVHLQAAGDLPAEITDALDAAGCPRLMLGSEALATETATPTPPTSRGADDLACIAFTSGSTGLPKGIRGRHGSLTHFIPWQREAFDLRGNDRYSLLSGLAHDPLHREVFTPLQTGATVVIPPPEILEMAGRPARWMGRQRITQAHLTPALGQLLVGQATGDTRPAASLPALRGAYYVGDVLTRHDVGRLQALAPAVRVINYYGSTETQRAVGYHEVAQSTSDVSQESEVIAVGRGMPDVQLLVLATDDRLAGIGEVGEICVRSPHLALGYLADDELTAARFVANPFASTADPTGDRLYRTGDLGRYRPDGEVEIVGRADRQVKIRGFRVELGEIEANLAGHPEVREAVVIRRTDAGGQGYLVAYVTGLGEPLPATASRELRDFLRQRLPDPIVPPFYMGLEALPLTPNRKVDRDALPAPEAARSATYVAPRTPAEEVLVELWREVLGLTKEFGVEDSFFELGGHSLLAAQLIARVQRAFDGVEIPLRQLFEAPTIAAQATAVTQAQGRGTGQLTELPPLVHDAENRFEPFPMTEVQEAYWVGRTGAFELGNVATHSYMEIELDLDLERLERVWQRLIEHHDMLRAVMLPDGRQKVLAEVPPYRIATLDLRGRSPEEAEQAIAEVRGELSHQVLDPEVWPLFDLRATRLADDAVRLHISRDLLIYDAWSSAVLFDQLMELYRQPERPLQPLEITFRDYVMAERGDRDSPQYQRAVAYWQGRLDTLPPAPELPLATSAAALERPRFERHAGRLVAATWRAVRQRGSRFGLTPSAVLLAAYAEALAAYCKSPRFTLNLTLFNRQPRHPQVNHLVGDFTSLTLLETDCRPGDSFLQLARRLQQQLWDDLDHRAVGGVWVQRQLARQGGGAPRAGMPVVFTSTLGLTGLDDEAGPDGEAPSGNEAPAGVEPEGEAGDLAGGQLMFNITQTPQVWLDQQISERDGQLFFTWDSVAGLFPDGLVGAMFEAYEDLLNRLEQEDTWLDRRQTLTPAAQLELVARANDTAQPVPQGLLHRPFLEQAAQHPEHTAVVAGGERLTYGEIEQLSARYARRLQQLGARPNQLVAVVMEKGWQQVAAVLAICRSGAAYQPIEASLPAERRQRLLERGEVEIALTQPHFAETLDWPDGLRVLAVERSTSGADDEPVSKLTTQPSDLAYVIFTSGSTGEPKGVMIDHRSALNTVIDVNQRFAIGADDRVLALSALGFDLSVWDIFGVLGAGGAVVMPEPAARRDPARWSELVTAEGVTLWNTVPALMEMYVEFLAGRDDLAFGPLRLVMMSGDWIPVTLPERIRAHRADIELVSLGGATEGSIWSILFPIGAVDPQATSIPYGHAMVNQTFHVLDSELAERPQWVPGELYIGGEGVAKGYWRDARQTALAYLPDPRPKGPRGGERLYRTGDLGRWLPDGEIEFLGREDFQVKVRGHRIELGEIEAALARHENVREAVVVALGEKRGSLRLAAYVVLIDGATATPPEALQDHLNERLPAYMVPAIFVFLEALPLTANGKVDRKALPQPAEEAPADGETRVLPRTPLEESIAGLWATVLGDVAPGDPADAAEAIGVHDDFFELGGDSLRATRLTVLVRQSLGVEVPLRELFEAPTIAGLAAAVAKASGRPLAPSLPPLVPDPAKRYEPFPMTEVQQAYWIGRTGAFELGNVATHSYLEIENEGVDIERFQHAIRRLIERHDMLRAVMLPDGRQRILKPSEVPPYEIQVLDLRQHDADAAEQALAEVRGELSHQVLDPERWPLFDIRATLLPGGKMRSHLSRDALIYDAWSTFVLGRELTLFYMRPEHEIEPLEISFRDYVLAEQALTETEIFAAALTYWRDRLPTLPAAPDLPLAVQPSALGRPRFERRSGHLPSAVWGRVKQHAGRFGLTPSAVLLTAFSEVLAAFSRNPRFTLNLTLFNRLPLHREIHQLVGDFTALALLEVAVPPGETLRQRARRVQEQLWSDLDHRYVGGVRVQREIARLRGSLRGATMPVVFTSTLGFPQPQGGDDEAEDTAAAEDTSQLIDSISQTPQVWLDHQVSEMAGMLAFNWDSVADLFPEGLVDAMFAAYERRLTELAEEAAWGSHDQDAAAVSRVPRSLAPAENLELYHSVNATAEPVPAGLLHEPFLARAAADRQATAVIAGGERLTYGDLEAISRRLAHRLLHLGAGRNRLVAVVMEKGWEQVAAVLAIQRAGAAYLPIEASLPADRRALLLARGGVEILLTQPHLADQQTEGVEVVVVDRGDGSETADLPAIDSRPGDLAYVIFTSGSTGEPKGVMIDHRGALNTCVDINRRFAVGPEDRVLALSALGFDLSVWDVFGVLAAGGTVVMPEPAARRDPARWLELVSAEGVTLWNTVPALMEMFVEYLGSRGEASFESLRLVMMSGDWIPVTLPERIRRLAGEVEVISLGGATEASIWSILYPIEEIEASAVSIPYGRAMVNQSFHVLDGELSERPLWVPGELFIGGIGLAQGYWRDPRKTALSFPPNPRPARPGERLYRTGDLGRFLPSGDIEFLGREDFQVKVRGHRIELGEIEAALGLHPAVREAIVVAPGERSRKQLVAVVVPVAGHELSEDDLGTGYLAERLPSYMVPQVFRFLPELPLSANGKVDRAAIERLAEGAATAPSEAGYVAPQGDFEERLAAIWEEILGVERVGVEDNFFELGGDSILGIRIVSRAAEAGLEIRPTALFEHQTIAGLVREQARQSATASPRRPAGAQSALVALQSGGTQDPLFCVHAAGGNVSGYGRLAQALGPDQPLYGLRARGLLPGEEPRQSVAEMADAYLEAIRAVRPEGPYRILGWSSGGHAAFEMAARLLAEGETVERLILLDTPSRMPQDGAKDERELLLNLLHGASQKPREELAALSFEQQLALVSELLKEAWGLPAGFDAEEAKRLLTVYSTNLAASRAFEPRSYGGRVALLLAGDAEDESADLGWGAWVDGELETFTVPGQHETLLLPKNLDVLASVVGKLLVED